MIIFHSIRYNGILIELSRMYSTTMYSDRYQSDISFMDQFLLLIKHIRTQSFGWTSKFRSLRINALVNVRQVHGFAFEHSLCTVRRALRLMTRFHLHAPVWCWCLKHFVTAVRFSSFFFFWYYFNPFVLSYKIIYNFIYSSVHASSVKRNIVPIKVIRFDLNIFRILYNIRRSYE